MSEQKDEIGKITNVAAAVAAAEAETSLLNADDFYANVMALERIKAMKQITIGEFPESVWIALRKANKDVMEEARSKSKTVAIVHDSFYGFAKKASGYRSVYDKPLFTEREKYFV